MAILITPHAELRMRDRGISETQVRMVFQNPKEVISVRYGRLAAFREFDDKKLVVIYERKDDIIEVITTLWVDDRRLKTLGFTRV
jgi:hypothetical protein